MRNITIGLDIGTSAVKMIIAEKYPSGEIHILGTTQKPSGGLRHGFVIDQDATTKAINNAAKEIERISNVPVKHAYLSAGGIKLEAQRAKGNIIVSRADGEITENDIKRAINQAESNLNKIVNRTILHRLPVAFKIDGEIIWGRPLGIKGEKLEADVLFITCLSQHLNDLIKSVEAVGIIIDDIIASPLSASYSTMTKRQKEVGAILVDLGAETTSVAVFEENSLISLEVFPFGSTHITNDIAVGMQIPLEAAEDLKFNYISDNQKKKLTNIIEARLDDIFELIGNHLKKIGRNELLPAGIILTGGGANLPNIENLAKNALHLPAKIASPSIPIKAHDKQIYNPKWATALGLCVLDLDEGLNPEVSDFNRKKSKIPVIGWIAKLLKHFLP